MLDVDVIIRLSRIGGIDSLTCSVEGALVLRFIKVFCLGCDVVGVKKPH